MYSDSESESETDAPPTSTRPTRGSSPSSDSDAELRATIRRKKRDFEMTERQIMHKLQEKVELEDRVKRREMSKRTAGFVNKVDESEEDESDREERLPENGSERRNLSKEPYQKESTAAYGKNIFL